MTRQPGPNEEDKNIYIVCLLSEASLDHVLFDQTIILKILRLIYSIVFVYVENKFEEEKEHIPLGEDVYIFRYF